MHFRRIASVLLVLVLVSSSFGRVPQASGAPPASRPNVIVIITDDQGYGDLGRNGNTIVQTPHIDRFAQQGVVLERFHVCPVCSPTRASLLTGRYHLRTGVVDTYLGRSMIDPGEVTMAEMLSAAGYRTGLFGKWHLGDNYPRRPIDQGFQKALWHRGGGIGQPADPRDNSYFDPVLQDNDKQRKFTGYCSDIFTSAAIEFIEQNRDRPFFSYLAYNCPHTPLQVADELVARYREASFQQVDIQRDGRTTQVAPDRQTTARVYAMVSNIDKNVGRLLQRLDELRLAEKTIVVFLTDNGPQQVRFNGGLRDTKGSTFDGGIRVPCFVRWPGRFAAGRVIDYPAAHIDIVPTLLDACGVEPPAQAALDGVSLLELLEGKIDAGPERLLFFQWHRGDAPQVGRACAVRSSRYKLVQPRGNGEDFKPSEAEWMLFDMQVDPGEKHDLAAALPEELARLKKSHEAWFADVASTRGFAPQRITIGSQHENPTTLTRQDWRGPNAGWMQKSIGHWELNVEREGNYELTVCFLPVRAEAQVRVEIDGQQVQQTVSADSEICTFDGVSLRPGYATLGVTINQPDDIAGATYVHVLRK